MSKQVNGANAQCGAPQNPLTRSLYVTVNTYNRENNQIGTRVVDMYHPGTRDWFATHLWWATHNGHEVVTIPSNAAEVAEYVANATQKLAAKHQAVA